MSAAHRRRRLLLIVPALAALVAGIVVGAGADGEPGDANPAAEEAAVPLEELIGARLMVRMSGVATPSLVRAARRGEIGGVIVFPGSSIDPGTVRSQIARLQRVARKAGRPPLLVSTDQEGGDVARFHDGPPSASAASLGRRAPNLVQAEGRDTGEYLADLGINFDLAPVLDLAFPGSFAGTRSFGRDPTAVAELGTAFAAGLADAGVLAAAKHFPGLGRASENTDFRAIRIGEAAAGLEEDLLPFREAIDQGVPAVMLASAVYDALDPSKPAVFSRKVVEGLLRRELGFVGLTISDDLNADAITAIESPGSAAVKAAAAGIDILLLARPGGVQAARRALLRSAANGRLDEARLRSAYDRIDQARNSLAAEDQGEG